MLPGLWRQEFTFPSHSNREAPPEQSRAHGSCCHGATSQELALGSLHQNPSTSFLLVLPGVEREDKHSPTAGATSAQPLPGAARRLCPFPSSPTHTRITNLPAPCSANASFCKQKLDAPKGLTGLVQVDACEETPPFQGKRVATTTTG